MTKSIFICECCNYSTRNKYDWNKHTQTKKHIKNSSIQSGEVKLSFNPSIVETIPKQPEHVCECGKTYKYYSGLSRHKTKCKFIKSTPKKSTDSTIVQQQRDQIASLESLLKKTIESQQEKFGRLPCIQLDDKLYRRKDVGKIYQWVKDEQAKKDEKLISRMTTSIKADEDVTMGIVTEVKTQLRKAEALKINYSTKKRE